MVTLTGAIDVGGNEFGGIESSKGSGVTETPALDVTDATLANGTEAYGKPTVWEDFVTGTVVSDAGDLTATSLVRANQVQYYLDGSHAVSP